MRGLTTMEGSDNDHLLSTVLGWGQVFYLLFFSFFFNNGCFLYIGFNPAITRWLQDGTPPLWCANEPHQGQTTRRNIVVWPPGNLFFHVLYFFFFSTNWFSIFIFIGSNHDIMKRRQRRMLQGKRYHRIVLLTWNPWLQTCHVTRLCLQRLPALLRAWSW